MNVPKTNDPYDFPSDESLKDLVKDDQVDSLVEWFFHNFEDPAENTPFESAEGGYQWIWGGPDDAREQLDNRFAAFIDTAVIDEAVERIERNGVEWVPSNHGIADSPEDYEEEPNSDVGEEPASPEEAASRVAASLGTFEAALDALDTPGIGHNKPPESIDGTALSKDDIAETRATIAGLKGELAAPIPAQDKLQLFSDQIVSVAKKVGIWLAKKADGTLTTVLGGIGAVVGTAVGTSIVEKVSPQHHFFIEAANKLALEIGHWISLLSPLF